MSDAPTSQGTSPEASNGDTGGVPSNEELADRQDELASKQDSLTEKVDEILGLVRGRGRGSEHAAPPGGGASAGSPTEEDIASRVQAELQRARQADADKAAADADQAERASMREQLAKLAETPPAPPIRRATRLLGWGSGR